MRSAATPSNRPDRAGCHRGRLAACLLSALVLACGAVLGVSAAWAAGTATTTTTTSTETSTTTSTETSTTTTTATSTTTNHTTATKTKTVTSTPTQTTTHHGSGKSSDIPWWVWVLIGFLVFGLLAAVWAVGRRQGRDDAVAYRDDRYGPPYYEDEPPRGPPRAPPPPPLE